MAAWSRQNENARREAFGYTCKACSHCCQGKVIQVNPYEIARLARRLGLATAVFRERCTEDGRGAILKRDETDTCIFLGKKGCSVHPDRPLVCRLYPLGRRVQADGSETWVHVEPHPSSAGQYTTNGTIAEYITAQDALPYMRAADDYADWVRRAAEVLDSLTADEPDDRQVKQNALLDLDEVIHTWCAENGLEEPADIEARRQLHLEILNHQLKG